MKINGKYKLVNLIAEDEIIRVVSREIGSGRPVVIHLMIRGYTEENKLLLKKLSSAGPDFRRCILETGEFEHVPCVVTEYFPESLREWLSKVPNERGPENENTATTHNDDFTLIFEEVGTPKPNTTASPAKPRTLGEFTMLFQNSESKAPVPEGVGDFTKLFMVPSLNRPEPVRKDEKAIEFEGSSLSTQPGDFKAQRRPGGLRPDTPAPTAAPPSTPEVVRKSSEFDEFERELRPQRGNDERKRPNPLDIVEGWHGIGPHEFEERVAPPVAPQPKGAASFSSTPAAVPLPPIILPKSRQVGGKGSYLPLIVVLSCLLLTATLALVFFVVMRG
ncbi:MAG: hypothetical protein ACJ746_16010 [Bryobacteraceae bacterium]